MTGGPTGVTAGPEGASCRLRRHARAGTPGSRGRSSPGTSRTSRTAPPPAPTTPRARRPQRPGRRTCAARGRPAARPRGARGSCRYHVGCVGRPALGGDRGVHAVVLDPHDRVLAQLAGLRADRGDHHDRPVRVTAQRVGLAAVGRLVLRRPGRAPTSPGWVRTRRQSHAGHNTRPRPDSSGPGRRTTDSGVRLRHERDRRSVRDLRRRRLGRRARLRGPDRPDLPPGEGARHGADRLRPARRAQRLPAAHRRRAAPGPRARADLQRRRVRAAHRQRPERQARQVGVLHRRRPADPRQGRLPVRDRRSRRRRRPAEPDRQGQARPAAHPGVPAADPVHAQGRHLRGPRLGGRRRAQPARGLRPDPGQREHARFKQTDADVGSFDGGYGSAYLARQVGQKFAREIFFLGDEYAAEDDAPDGRGQPGRRPRRPRGRRRWSGAARSTARPRPPSGC